MKNLCMLSLYIYTHTYLLFLPKIVCKWTANTMSLNSCTTASFPKKDILLMTTIPLLTPQKRKRKIVSQYHLASISSLNFPNFPKNIFYRFFSSNTELTSSIVSLGCYISVLFTSKESPYFSFFPMVGDFLKCQSGYLVECSMF